MKAQAYAYAAGLSQTPPREIETSNLLHQFGAAGVFGGTVPYSVMLRVSTVNAILRAHGERARTDKWAEWARDNPELNSLLTQAKLAHDESLKA